MAADHDIDARHFLGHAHIVARAEMTVLPSFHAAVAETDNHIHLLRLAHKRDHLFGGFNEVGEHYRTRAGGVNDGLFADHPENTEANAAAHYHNMTAEHPILDLAQEIGQRW